MNDRKVTIRDIAAKAGVHYTTVSRALAGHPKLPESTKKRIRLIADELGYVPDPMLSALTAYRTRQSPRAYQGNLVWVTNGHSEHEMDEHEIFNLYREGARKRAAELGYALEDFWLRADNMSAKRASDILAARNIRGVLICPQPHPGETIKLTWDRFSAVTFGYTLGWPQLHTIAAHAFRALVQTVESVRQLGYRRIGFALPEDRDARTFHLWSGAFLACQHQWPKKSHVPLHCPKEIVEAEFIRWVDRYQPEVIISSYHELIDFLEQNGRSVPKDIGFASPSLVSGPRQVSGIDENSRSMGKAAMDMLVGMLQRNDRGIPTMPQYLLIEGQWKSGDTLKQM